jgi:hypothetical protein
MATNKRWVVCEHVMNGTAGKVTLGIKNTCLCSICASDSDIVYTENVCTLDEDRLAFTLKGFDQIDNLELLGDIEGRSENINTDKRSETDRRTGHDQRMGGASAYNGPERRGTKYRRNDLARRIKTEDTDT